MGVGGGDSTMRERERERESVCVCVCSFNSPYAQKAVAILRVLVIQVAILRVYIWYIRQKTNICTCCNYTSNNMRKLIPIIPLRNTNTAISYVHANHLWVPLCHCALPSPPAISRPTPPFFSPSRLLLPSPPPKPFTHTHVHTRRCRRRPSFPTVRFSFVSISTSRGCITPLATRAWARHSSAFPTASSFLPKCSSVRSMRVFA